MDGTSLAKQKLVGFNNFIRTSENDLEKLIIMTGSTVEKIDAHLRNAVP